MVKKNETGQKVWSWIAVIIILFLVYQLNQRNTTIDKANAEIEKGNVQFERDQAEIVRANAEIRKANSIIENYTTELENYSTELKTYTSIASQHTQNLQAFNEQAVILTEKITIWNTLIDQSNKGVPISRTDMMSAKTGYEQQAAIFTPKIKTYSDFITKHEEELKTLGLDVDAEKQMIAELSSTIKTNINVMDSY